ncbi:TPA: hypothetical protein JLE79_004148 [Escherichia coli]|nr:hypothetical protein [Escherichia coli]HAV9941219.1 hypothetical protein [Escherichia coli]
MNCAALLAVHTVGADTRKNGRKLPLRAAGYFRISFVINTYKSEDQLFVSRIHKEGNIQVCAALNGIVKIIQLLRQKIIFVELHNIAGEFASFEVQFFVYGV